MILLQYLQVKERENRFFAMQKFCINMNSFFSLIDTKIN